MLEAGTKAPDFKLSDDTGKIHQLSDYRGKKVLLYFYPKDNTPGCTQQACGFGELYQDFLKQNTIIIGVSKDSQRSHAGFREKYGLPFVLLSDPELEAIQAYDVWHEKKMAGRSYMGVVRSTYLVDEGGIIRVALDKVKAKENPLQMLQLLSAQDGAVE